MKLAPIYIGNKKFELELLNHEAPSDDIIQRCYVIALAHLAEKAETQTVTQASEPIDLTARKIEIIHSGSSPLVNQCIQAGYKTTKELWEGRPVTPAASHPTSIEKVKDEEDEKVEAPQPIPPPSEADSELTHLEPTYLRLARLTDLFQKKHLGQE